MQAFALGRSICVTTTEGDNVRGGMLVWESRGGGVALERLWQLLLPYRAASFSWRSFSGSWRRATLWLVLMPASFIAFMVRNQSASKEKIDRRDSEVTGEGKSARRTSGPLTRGSRSCPLDRVLRRWSSSEHVLLSSRRADRWCALSLQSGLHPAAVFY